MRPLKLSMTAFGPYAGNEIVDFRCLGESALFLIHGPTGAGKTTLLDAICYALFGKTSGDLRDGKAMRSDYVDSTGVTEVVFDFSLGGTAYRVRRQPEREVQKKRGDGTTTIAPSASLWQRDGLTDEDAEGSVVASDTRRVTEAMEKLLGFKYEQFRQVVLLPQGEFRRLLLADSKDREAILETLFQTEIYRRIEEYFKQQAKELTEKVKELEDKKRWTLEQARVVSGEQLAEQLAEGNKRCQDLAAAMTVSQQTMQAVQNQLATERLLKAQFDDRQQARAWLLELAADEPAVEVRRNELARAQQALPLEEETARIRERANEYDVAKEQLVKDGDKLLEGQQAAAMAAGLFRQEKARQSERDQATEAVRQLSGIKDKLGQLTEARDAHASAADRAKTAGEYHQKLKSELQQLTEVRAKAQVEFERLKAEAVQLVFRQTSYKQAAQLVKYRESREELLRDYRKVEQQEKAAQERVDRLSLDVEAARRDFDTAQMECRQGQAAELANSLLAGQPCPVCGSEHHPAPAHSPAGALSAAQLEAKQQLLRQKEEELSALREPLTKLTVSRSVIEENGKSIRQLLGEAADTALEVLRSSALAAEQQLAIAVQAMAGQAELERRITELDVQLKALQEGLEKAGREAQNSQVDCETTKAVLAERETSVPANLQTTEKLQAALNQATKLRDSLDQALEAARQSATTAASHAEGLKAAEGVARENLAALVKKLAEEQEKFARQVCAAGFSTEQEFTAALRSAADIQLLRLEVQNHDQEKLLAVSRIERADGIIKDHLEPDLPVTEQALRQAETVVNELIAAQATLKEQVKKQQECSADLAKIDGELDGKAQEFAVLGRLSEVANGQNASRVSFHRFVLATLLEDVMLAANARLKKMSRGRYALRRMTGQGDKRAAGGLDLEIEDSYTGAARHVATLSGGETFIASLALALGLADAVQSFSGGIYLDTIFVDEGFGTLDPESLDMALQALVELRHRGRLVGIISHVPELKERIETRLEIIPTERGSTTRWSTM